MKIYTKTGDGGTTSLYSGERVPKSDPRIEVLGSIDELTSHIGGLKVSLPNTPIAQELENIQKILIRLMGDVASTAPDTWQDKEEAIRQLEKSIDKYMDAAGGFKGFILPGANPLSAKADIARTVARRADRALAKCEGIEKEVRQYINRLADYLYSVARYIDKEFAKAEEDMKTQIVSKENDIKENGVREGQNMSQSAVLNLELANQVIEKVKEYAAYKGINVVIAVVSKEGNPISVQAMDDSFVISYELAIKKAFTAAALKMPTHELAQLTAKGAQFEGLENMLDAKIVTLGGGYPIKVNGTVIGAVGVSGGAATDDIDFARYGAQFA
jgi:ATP:cob(I)alamin adenosyltransferase